MLVKVCLLACTYFLYYKKQICPLILAYNKHQCMTYVTDIVVTDINANKAVH